MAAPLVSVVVPTHYRNERLRTTLESVGSQSHDPLEVVVVDDSGEAHAEETARAALDELSEAADVSETTYVAHDENEGAHAARDTGLRHASGDYVQFLDDDDRLLPEKIERQVSVLERDGGTGVVYCGLEYEDGATHAPDPTVDGDVLMECLRFYNHPLTTSTMLIDASVLSEVRPLDRDCAGADDIRMAIKLAQRTRFGYVDDVLVVGGRLDESRGTSWGGVSGRWDILEEFSHLYDQFSEEVRHAALSETYQLQGRRYLDDDWWSARAIYSFAQALRFAPEPGPIHVGEFLSAIAGQPGRTIARRVAQ